MYWFGVSLGALLFVAKLGSFWLLTSTKDEHTGEYRQRMIPKWGIFGAPMPMRDRIHQSTLLLLGVDALAGYMGMHVLRAFGGSIIAMIAMTTYTVTCMATIFSGLMLDNLKKRISTMTIRRYI